MCTKLGWYDGIAILKNTSHDAVLPSNNKFELEEEIFFIMKNHTFVFSAMVFHSNGVEILTAIAKNSTCTLSCYLMNVLGY